MVIYVSKSKDKRRMKGAFGSILVRKGCLPLAGYQESGKCLTLLCLVLVYQTSQGSVKKYGEYG